MTERVKYVPAADLEALALRLLTSARVRGDIAGPTARGLVWTSLRGIDSHGIRLLPHYLAAVRAGRLSADASMHFERTGAGTGLLDADHTFGHAAGIRAMDHAIQLATEAGIGAVAVRNSSHCGALSFFAHEAARHDMVGMVFTHATPRIRTPGSTRPFFGNNPMCLVAPMRDEDPFCYDAATSAMSFNAVQVYATDGRTLPPGVAADATGRETADPNAATQLIPIGDYKGFGLSMLVDVLCAVLTGMPSGNRVTQMFGDSLDAKRNLGHFFCALRISAFRDPEVFKDELQELAERVREEPTVDAVTKVLVPGDPEKAAWVERTERGIPIPVSLWSELAMGSRQTA